MKKDYKIQNPTAPATRKQRQQLWANTGKDWWSQKLEKDITKGDASDLIGKIFDHLAGKADWTHSITDAVHTHTGDTDWDISQLRKWFAKKRKKSPVKNGKETPETPEVPETPQETPQGKPETPEPKPDHKPPSQENKELEEEKKRLEEELEKAKEEAEKAKKEAEEFKDKNNIPEYKLEDLEYIKPEFFDEVAALLKAGLNVIFTGARGAGKSLLAEKLAVALDKEYYAIPVAGMRRNHLIGTKDILKDGSTKYTPSRLVQGIQKNAIIHLEEGNSMDTDQTLVLNPLLADRKIDTPDGVVECHEGAVFILSANSNGRETDPKYRGAKIQDQSFLDRFGCTFRVDYDARVESEIRKNFRKIGLSKAASDYLRDKLEGLRKAIKDVAMPYDASTRRMVYAIRAHLGGLGMERAFELAFINTLTPAELKKVQNYIQ